MSVGIGEALDGAWTTFGQLLDVQSVANPQLFKVALLLVVGIVGGRILSEVVLRILRMTSLDELGVKSDIQFILRRLNYHGTVSEFIADILRWSVYLLTVFALFNLFGSNLIARYSEVAITWASTIVAVMFIVMLGFLIAERIGSIVIQIFRAGRISGRVDESHAEIPLYVVIGKIVKYIGYIITIIIALGFLGVNSVVIHILIALFGLGVVIAFVLASKHLLWNIAISVYFQVSRIFRGGEHVRIGEYAGEIVSIRPMYTKIKSADGDIYYIPNTELLSTVIEHEGG